MGRKKSEGEFRQVGFRMPLDHFELLAAVAEARGIDLSALLNQIVADALPELEQWLSRRKMLKFSTAETDRLLENMSLADREIVEAIVADAWEKLMGKGKNPALDVLIHNLQEALERRGVKNDKKLLGPALNLLFVRELIQRSETEDNQRDPETTQP